MAYLSAKAGLPYDVSIKSTMRAGMTETADASFEELYQSEHQPLVRLAIFLTGSSADAETIVHDAFIGYLRKGPPPTNPPAFLRTAVVNAARSWHRRQRVALKHKPRLAASQDDVSDLEFDHCFELLDALTPRQRAAVVLRYYEMRTEEEIAEFIGCRRGTVKSLLNRALHTLRKELSS